MCVELLDCGCAAAERNLCSRCELDLALEAGANFMLDPDL
jgi:hypothetical protein